MKTLSLRCLRYDSKSFCSYDAIGTIEHRGVLYGGHYISYTKHPVDGLWLVCAQMWCLMRVSLMMRVFCLTYRESNAACGLQLVCDAGLAGT